MVLDGDVKYSLLATDHDPAGTSPVGRWFVMDGRTILANDTMVGYSGKASTLFGTNLPNHRDHYPSAHAFESTPLGSRYYVRTLVTEANLPEGTFTNFTKAGGRHAHYAYLGQEDDYSTGLPISLAGDKVSTDHQGATGRYQLRGSNTVPPTLGDSGEDPGHTHSYVWNPNTSGVQEPLEVIPDTLNVNAFVYVTP